MFTENWFGKKNKKPKLEKELKEKLQTELEIEAEKKDLEYKEKAPQDNPYASGGVATFSDNEYNLRGYNDPAFFKEYAEKEPMVEETPGADIGEYMQKYGLEEWELVDLMKKCEDHRKGKAPKPLKDGQEIVELSRLYRDYVAAKSEDGMPYNEEERKFIEAGDLADLKELKTKFNDTVFGENWKGDQLYIELGKQINHLQNKIDEDIKNGPNKIKKQEIEKKTKKEASAEKEYKENLKEVDEWGEETRKLWNSAINYLRNPARNPKPKFANGEELTTEQAIEAAGEYASDAGWPRFEFRAETFKGKRQLYNFEPQKDEGGKIKGYIKYFMPAGDLPEGKYYAEPNADKVFSVVNKEKEIFTLFIPLKMMIKAEAEKPVKKQFIKKSA